MLQIDLKLNIHVGNMNPEAPVFQPEKNFDKCNTIKVVSTLNVHHNANIKVDPQSKWLSLVDVTYHFPQATGDDQRITDIYQQFI